MSKPHTIEELQAMVAWCREHHQSPSHWLAKLNAARVHQLKTEVKTKHKQGREAKRAQEVSA